MAGKIFTNIKMLFVSYMIHQVATVKTVTGELNNTDHLTAAHCSVHGDVTLTHDTRAPVHNLGFNWIICELKKHSYVSSVCSISHHLTETDQKQQRDQILVWILIVCYFLKNSTNKRRN